MMYKITIEELYEVEGEDYPKAVEIYSQRIANLDVEDLVARINKKQEASKVWYTTGPGLIGHNVTGTQPLTGDYPIGESVQSTH